MKTQNSWPSTNMNINQLFKGDTHPVNLLGVQVPHLDYLTSWQQQFAIRAHTQTGHCSAVRLPLTVERNQDDDNCWCVCLCIQVKVYLPTAFLWDSTGSGASEAPALFCIIRSKQHFLYCLFYHNIFTFIFKWRPWNFTATFNSILFTIALNRIAIGNVQSTLTTPQTILWTTNGL